ncbi:hypothetical protein IscW_ISCW003546 [Ixodes scapularis]|uniref:Uncharacterized protein n=1 Tax=Ixodes scapularis TaxID=6945 RepID=B7PJU8_IXOSC|nr:hypothetical protein IscW_ISCW003546 [Ixodes scapularis]|eukprot:XP_002408687.1 hypothetical protein IscW_ISCW003546 [Ixodes scapularis]
MQVPLMVMHDTCEDSTHPVLFRSAPAVNGLLEHSILVKWIPSADCLSGLTSSSCLQCGVIFMKFSFWSCCMFCTCLSCLDLKINGTSILGHIFKCPSK